LLERGEVGDGGIEVDLLAATYFDQHHSVVVIVESLCCFR
jgi:hypothetical protein